MYIQLFRGPGSVPSPPWRGAAKRRGGFGRAVPGQPTPAFGHPSREGIFGCLPP